MYESSSFLNRLIGPGEEFFPDQIVPDSCIEGWTEQGEVSILQENLVHSISTTDTHSNINCKIK
jgi:hypothetical protein